MGDNPYKVCLSDRQVLYNASLILSLAFGILLLSAILGHVGSGSPISQLGNRPQGKGLFSYLVNYMKTGVGVKGYDSSLGSFAPPVRALFHIGFFIAFYAMGLMLLSTIVTIGNLRRLRIFCFDHQSDKILNDDFNSFQGLLFSYFILIYFAIYMVVWMVYIKITPGVSDPGGPRQHKIRRSPKWENKNTEFPRTDIQWRCDVSKSSHDVTKKRFEEQLKKETKQVFSPASASGPGKKGVPINLGLSGEPDGRQIWSWYETHTEKKSKVDEELVDSMALGGRKKGFNPEVNPNSCDQVFRAQQIRSYLQAGNQPPSLKQKPKTPLEAARKAAHFYSMLQTEDGHWGGDYGGPHFLMPGLIISWYAMGKPDVMLDTEQCALMKHYLLVHQQIDGGWGSHIESPSTMFGTVLCYISLRLLGCNAEDASCVKARKFIRDQGGAVMASSWAKFWMCLLGCMDWKGHNSIPPEMFLLPNWIPFHPGRLWCHCRMVYLPMSFLYGKRYVYEKAETDPLILDLRKELYCGSYDSIQWDKTRHCVADVDNYSPIPMVMSFLQNCLACYENWRIFQPFKNFVRTKGLEFAFEYMGAEDLQTNFIDIGPVNKAINLVSAFCEYGDIDHPIVQNHMMRIPDYLWVAEDGMKMQGYNGSQCWDTSFAIQAMAECHLLDEFPEVSKKVWSYLERTQILSTETSKSSAAFLFETPQNRDRFYRHVSAGGWPFSTSAHGWPIADCTGEGLKGALALTHSKSIQECVTNGSLEPIDEKRFQDAVNILLTYQNEDGGWATYENNRGFRWYEQLNPSEVFGDIMIDYSYVELTMASLTALAEFHNIYPSHRTKEIKHSLSHGRQFIKSIQRSDGSWYGSWACCFSYGCWFGVEGLVTSGEPLDSPALKRCCDFLLSHQRENGGWGEDFTSCYDKSYAENGMKSYGDDGSGVVNTAWVLLALSCAKSPNVNAIKRGVSYLMKRQLPSGDWPQEGISGVFNRSIGITYTAYRNVFPMWALGRCVETYGNEIFES